MKLISVVIPVYNSEKTIKIVLNNLKKQFDILSDYKFEIILINDNSKDNTLKVIEETIEKEENIKIINLSKNFGQHNALMAGFEYSEGDYIIYMDDDLQTPPSEISKLIYKIEESSFDVVYGKYRKKKHKWYRKIGSKINDIMANMLIDKPKDIDITSFCIMKRFIVKEIIKYDKPYPYIFGLVFRITNNVGDVIVNHKKRVYGESNYNFKKLLFLWLNGFTNFSVKPLRISSLLGVIFSILSLLGMIYVFLQKLIYPDIEVGWTSLMVTIIFFGSIQLISLGLIGEYIGRIFLSINKKPQYIIKEIFNDRKTDDEK